LESLIRHLRIHAIEVRLCARKEWQGLFTQAQATQWLHPCIPWSSYDSKRKYRIASYFLPNFWKFIRQLRVMGRGAVGLDPRGDIRSVILLYLAGCYRVITLASYLGSDLRIPRCPAQLA